MVDKEIYNITLSQSFSPCGNFLLVGDNYGEIRMFNLCNILKSTGNGPELKPILFFKSPGDYPICSMASTGQFLITGMVGVICGWDWKSILALKPEIAWSINIPIPKDSLYKADVNSLIVSDIEDQQYLYAGGGDNVIYVFSLEDGKLVRRMEGHTDYIHSLNTVSGRGLVSGSEDGTVRLWDLRQFTMTGMLEPHKIEKVARPHLGKWIGDVSSTEDWLVCGGGPRLSMWHLRSMGLMTLFAELEDRGIHVTKLQQESVLAGGACSHFYQLSYTGQVLSRLDTSSHSIFSAVYTDQPREVLSLGGSSNSIDICTNFKYRHQILSISKSGSA